MTLRDVVWTAILFVAATPMFLLRALAGLLPQRSDALERGAVDCATCGGPIALSRMNQCPGCGFVSVSSLVLPCEVCGDEPSPFVTCEGCGATNEVEL